MVFDYSELRSQMTRKHVRLADLSQMTGIGVATLSRKMVRGQKFDCEQALLIAEALEITDMNPYFFTLKLNKTVK